MQVHDCIQQRKTIKIFLYVTQATYHVIYREWVLLLYIKELFICLPAQMLIMYLEVPWDEPLTLTFIHLSLYVYMYVSTYFILTNTLVLRDQTHSFTIMPAFPFLLTDMMNTNVCLVSYECASSIASV